MISWDSSFHYVPPAKAYQKERKQRYEQSYHSDDGKFLVRIRDT
jgi:hypothetical protein